MHAKPSISLLAFALAGLLSQDVLALLFDQHGGIIHLPLNHVEQRRSDVHPQIRHQQYVNRAYRRFARMTGRAEPSDIELHNKLIRRIEFLKRSQPELLSRYNHGPVYNKRQQIINQGGASTTTIVVTPANPPSAKNSLGLDIEANDAGYHATIQIGTPRDFRVTIDSDFWVLSENCKNKNDGTCIYSGEAWNIAYGTGGVAGLSLADHKFGVVKFESIAFYNSAFDGILGTAKSGNITPIEALAENDLIAFSIISYKIPRLADGKNDGEVTFGGLNPTKFDPATLVTLENISPVGLWELSIEDISASGMSLRLNNRIAVFDTATDVILAPRSDAIAIHDKIPGAIGPFDGTFNIPCKTTVSVALAFGGSVFEIDSRDLVSLPLDPAKPEDYCTSSIAVDIDFEDSQTVWLLGNAFLKNAYFSHDVRTNTIKLAKLV